jgi:LysM repeat protein
VTPRRAVAAAVVLVTAAAIARADEPTVDYVVRAGDTCLGISRRELGSAARLAELHRLNPGLGPLPHQLVPGQHLRLPGRQVDAHITHLEGKVQARAPDAEAWQAAALAMDLYRLWRVASGKASAAEITFVRDGSALQMREDTIVVIYGEREAQAQTGAATLVTGALRSHLAELAGEPLVVATPAADATLRGGSAVLAAEEDGMLRIANHRGPRADLRSRARGTKPVAVAEGMGSWVEPGQAPRPPRPLPPPPAWIDGPTTFAALDGAADIDLRWRGGATGYRVELARDVDGRDVVVAVTVPGSVTAFRGERLPIGAYYAFVAAIDADGLEGAPAAPLRVAIEPFALLPPEGAPAVAGALVGGRVVAPDGYTCGGEGRTFRIVHAGDVEVVCTGANGATAPLHVVAQAPAIHIASGALRRGERTIVEIETTLPVAAVVSLSSPDARVDAVVPLSDRRLRAAVTPREDVERVSLVAAIGGVQVSTVDLPAPSSFPRASLAAHATLLTLDEQIAPGGAAAFGFLGGGGLVLRTSRDASLEAEIEAGTSAGGRLVYSARGRAAIRSGGGAFRPVVSFGAGVLGSGGDAATVRGLVLFGLGFEHALERGLDLRVEALFGLRGGIGDPRALAGLFVGAVF